MNGTAYKVFVFEGGAVPPKPVLPLVNASVRQPPPARRLGARGPAVGQRRLLRVLFAAGVLEGLHLKSDGALVPAAEEAHGQDARGLAGGDADEVEEHARRRRRAIQPVLVPGRGWGLGLGSE